MHKLLTAMFITAAVLVGGCRVAPIYNVNDAPIASAPKPLTLQEVEDHILRAGNRMGWRMRAIKPGEIQGTLELRTHTAVVSIPYTTNKYSILYRSSVNLNEDGDKIHSNYNGWVQNLDREIRRELDR